TTISGGTVDFAGGASNGAVTLAFVNDTVTFTTTSQSVVEISGYSATSGDQFDLVPLLKTAYDAGTPAGALVRAVEDSSGTFANLQVNTGGGWTTLAKLDNFSLGTTFNVELDPALPPVTLSTGTGILPRDAFHGDSLSDLLLQNTDGATQMWLMNGIATASMASLGNPGSTWHVAATGDFNHDAKADLVWQNTDGTAGIWLMNGSSFIGSAGLGNPGASWHVIATGDFNNDGNADILWQNTDGTAGIWEMNGRSLMARGPLGNPGASWHAIGTGDFNGDGHADILWQNTDGTAGIWEMNGTSLIASGPLGNPGSSWHAIGPGDFN